MVVVVVVVFFNRWDGWIHERLQVLEQALWLLGNLAGEGATARDAVLAVDALPPLVRCLERHQVCVLSIYGER